MLSAALEAHGKWTTGVVFQSVSSVTAGGTHWGCLEAQGSKYRQRSIVIYRIIDEDNPLYFPLAHRLQSDFSELQ